MTTALLLHQIRLNQKSFWRNPESAFFNFAMPLGVLLIFGATSANDTVPGRDDVDVLTLFVPGILAFGIVVVAYGNLAATLALLRADGVLKRIRATPLNPTVYLSSQILSVLVTTLLIAAATIVAAGIAFGALPRAAAIPQLLVVLVLGITCCAALSAARHGVGHVLRQPPTAARTRHHHRSFPSQGPGRRPPICLRPRRARVSDRGHRDC